MGFRMNKNNLILGLLILFTLMGSTNLVNAISQTVTVDVIETDELKIYYKLIDEVTQEDFAQGVSNSSDFIQRTYPISDDGLIQKVSNVPLYPPTNGTMSSFELSLFMLQLKVAQEISLSEHGVGLVTPGWIGDHISGTPPDSGGFTFGRIPSTKLVDVTKRKTSAHEIGHSFNLCDEYGDFYWLEDKEHYGSCPNGDSDNNGSLDSECPIDGCPTTTFQELYPYGEIVGNNSLNNFMGASENPGNLFNHWVDNMTYTHLLSSMEVVEGLPLPGSQEFILISYLLFENGSVEYINSYVSEDLSTSSNDDFVNNGQNFSTLLFASNGTLLSNLTFDVDFSYTADNLTIPTDVVPITMVLPFDSEVHSIDILDTSQTTLEQVNKTPNTPTLSITSNISDQVFREEPFNLTWDSTDADNDSIMYAILFSENNGSTYTALEVDYNETLLTIDPTNLPYCDVCKLKILATDGINTNTTTSAIFSIPPEVIFNFSLLNTSSLNSVFEFRLFDNLSKVSTLPWIFDTDDSISFNSTEGFSLDSSEDIFVIIEHNYSSAGDYNVTTNVSVGFAIDSETIEVSI